MADMNTWWSIIIAIGGAASVFLIALPFKNNKVLNLIKSIFVFINDLLPTLRKRIVDNIPLSVEDMQKIVNDIEQIRDDIMELVNKQGEKEKLLEAKESLELEGNVTWTEAKLVVEEKNAVNSRTLKAKNTVTGLVAKIKPTPSEEAETDIPSSVE